MTNRDPHTPQESDMPTITRTVTIRLDPDLVALLAEIRDRLPEYVKPTLDWLDEPIPVPRPEPADITEEPPVGPGVRMVTIRWDDARKLLNLARTAWRVAGRGDAHPTRLDQRTSAALDAAPLSESSVNVTETPDLSTEDAGTSSEPAPGMTRCDTCGTERPLDAICPGCEPAPADVDPDKALAKVLNEIMEDDWLTIDLARAAREHIEAEMDECYAKEDATAHDRADKAEAELRMRELHHFEEEQGRDRAEADLDRVTKERVAPTTPATPEGA